MKNQELSQIFNEISFFLEMEGVAFKPQAYRRAALALANLDEDIKAIYQQSGLKALEKIPGVGSSIAEKIEEYLKKGKISYYEKLKAKLPIKLKELMMIEGLGPKRIKILYQKLKIKDLKSLEKAAQSHKIAPLFGFGPKSEQNILQGIEFVKKSKGRFLLGEILPIAREIQKKLQNLKEVEKIEVGGSVRRRKETIGDLDFYVVSKNPEKVIDHFCQLEGVVKIWGRGSTKASVHLKDGFDVDLRVIPEESYGSALQYFTGSREHNIKLRKLALDQGLKLNEYGLFLKSKKIAGRTEEEIYRTLGLALIPPELREDQGEIEAAFLDEEGKSQGLPKLIGYHEIKGDLHCHSDWNGGENSIEEMVGAAQKMGYEYLGIADHTKFLRIEKGLEENDLFWQGKEIEKINSKFQNLNLKFKVLHGCEANILNDGSLDIKDETLAKLDYVIAGVHSNLKMPKNQMTLRIITAMRNPNVDIISHPTGRILKRRSEYEVDFEKILKVAQETKTILEINSSPDRLDLGDWKIRRARELGVKMVINTDSHHQNQLRFMELGISQARRGWAEKKDIINTQPLDKLLKFFK